MKTLATNINNDLFVDAGGGIALINGIDALANVSKNAVLVNQGELIFNVQKGIPYMDTIFADNVNVDIFQARIVQTLESLDGVNRVSGFSFEIIDGVYSYSAEVDTQLGTVVLNG